MFSFAVIATTVALIAVFLPLAYQKTTTGRVFTEFAVTICGAVIVSTFVALTLTPTMCARVLRPLEERKVPKLLERFNNWLTSFTKRYLSWLEWALDHPKSILGIVGVSIILSLFFYNSLEREFLPDEDKGRLFSLAIAPEGSTPEYTDRMVQQMEAIISQYPETAGYFSAVALPRNGPGKGSEGLMFVRFNEDRDRSVQDLLGGPNGISARFFTEVEGAFAIAILPKAISSGFDQRFQLIIKGQDLDKLSEQAEIVVNKLREKNILDGIRTTFQFNKPELEVTIDRDRAGTLGVSIRDIAESLQTLFGGQNVSSFTKQGEEYDVIVQLDRKDRLTPEDINEVYVRNDKGELIQLSNLVSLSKTAGPSSIFHHNRFRSANIEGTPRGDIALGTIMELTEQVLAESMPATFSYEWGGEAENIKDTGTETFIILLLAILTIYIVLSAQFESLVHPLTVMLSLPLAALGAFGSLWGLARVNDLGSAFYGWANYSPDPPFIANVLSSIVPRIPSMTINIFSQIGIVLLLGLVTKNSILLVEFANQMMNRGMQARDAVLEAAKIRLRPILMTAVGTISGILPIAIGLGAGAEARRPMGVAAVGGMLTSTVLTLFVIPVVYVLFDKLSRKIKFRLGFVNSVLLSLALFSCLIPQNVAAEKEDLTIEKPEEKITKELSLEQALIIAAHHNKELLQAKAKIEEQHGVMVEARSFLLPKFTAEANFDIEDEALLPSFGDDDFGSNKNWQSKIELRQPLFGADGTRHYQQQKIVEKAVTQQLKEEVSRIFYEVSEKYYATLLAKETVRVRETSVNLLSEELEMEKNRLSAGTVSEFNVLRAEVALANSKTPLIRAKNDLEISKQNLIQSLGIDESLFDKYTLPDKPKDALSFTPYNKSLDDVLSDALKERPLLKQLKTLEEAADKGIDVQTAKYYPDVEAIASYNLEKSRFSDELDDKLEGWRAGVEVTWNVFDSFETSGKVQQARAKHRIARYTYEKALRDVEIEVRKAFSSLTEARALLKASNKVVSQAKESLRLARNRLSAGVATQLDVLDATVSLTEAETNNIQALHDYALSVAKINYTTGNTKNLIDIE